jgi:hypothetical protein
MAEGLGVQPLRTKSDVLMGTPTYMSPEQCRGAKLATDRSDVYSLGVLLYQMLAGYPPFLGASMGDLIAMHLMDEPPPLVDSVPSLSPKIAKLVYAMLAKKPESRPSMEKAQQTLLRLEEETPSLAPSVSPRRETAKPDLDSQHKTLDVPAGEPAPSPSRAKPSVDLSRALPSRIVSDSRHVHIPKRTLALILGAFVCSTLVVTTGILLGTQSQRASQRSHSVATSEQSEPESALHKEALAHPPVAGPPVATDAALAVREDSVNKTDRGSTSNRDAASAKHSDAAHPLAGSGKSRTVSAGSEGSVTVAGSPVGSVAAPSTGQTPVPTSASSPAPASETGTPSSVTPSNAVATAPASVPPSPTSAPAEIATHSATPSAAPTAIPTAIPATNSGAAAATEKTSAPASPAPRGADDPFNPLRTAEDYLLQGSYRRAMDLATQFGKQEPMRAWEIYGRAACGLRWTDKAQRALRELVKHQDDRRVQSLTSYCRLHKLSIGE